MNKIKRILISLFTMISMTGFAQEQPGSQAVLDNIHARKSVRSYTDEPVTPEQVETLLRAAMAAPSGKNVQPWRFVVVTQPETKQKLAVGFNKMIATAPVAIVICGLTANPSGIANNNWTADCAAATENLLLAAESLGLGAVWTACYPYDDRMQPAIEALGLPDDVTPYCIVPVGHPAGDNKPKNKWNPGHIHYEKW
jgi:nitroreductase